MEKISWTDHVRNDEVLLRVSEQRNILHEIRKRKANCIGHILRRNCLIKEVIEGKIQGRIEVTRRRGRRRKKLLDDLGDKRGYSHLKEEALDRIKWRNLSSDRLLMMMTMMMMMVFTPQILKCFLTTLDFRGCSYDGTTRKIKILLS
jgi:hypothetical protein